jgi:hypothetical protein
MLHFSLENKKPAAGLRPPGDHWSGEATRTQGFAVEETRVDVMIGDEAIQDQAAIRKERPIWMSESTIIAQDTIMVRVQMCLLTFSRLFSSILQNEELGCFLSYSVNFWELSCIWC